MKVGEFLVAKASNSFIDPEKMHSVLVILYEGGITRRVSFDPRLNRASKVESDEWRFPEGLF